MDILPGWLQDPDAVFEPPKPRVMTWKVILPWFNVAGGAVFILQRFEDVMKLDQNTLRNPLRFLQLMGSQSLMSALVMLAGSLALKQHTLGIRLTFFLVTLMAFVMLILAGLGEVLSTRVMLLFLCMMLSLVGVSVSWLFPEKAVASLEVLASAKKDPGKGSPAKGDVLKKKE